MEMVQPLGWAEALTAKAEQPHLLPIAGGTDVMVEINFDSRRPQGLLDLTRACRVSAGEPRSPPWGASGRPAQGRIWASPFSIRRG